MKLQYPLPKYLISQRFSQNFNPLYASQGQVGHTGIDFAGAWGMPIKCAVTAYVYSLMNMGEAPNKYRAVFTLVQGNDGYYYEVSYGHIIDTPVKVGQIVHAGEIIANNDTVGRVGNYGDVYSGNHYVTNAEKLAGSHAGAHLHFQVRKLIRVEKLSFGKQYIFDAYGTLKLDGYYYEVVDFNNGFNGCVDPQTFFDGIVPKFLFTKDLIQGMRSNDVRELQKRLNLMGYKVTEGEQETDYFGDKTKNAVIEYQKDNGIDPIGRVGPKTRALLNK